MPYRVRIENVYVAMQGLDKPQEFENETEAERFAAEFERTHRNTEHQTWLATPYRVEARKGA